METEQRTKGFEGSDLNQIQESAASGKNDAAQNENSEGGPSAKASIMEKQIKVNMKTASIVILILDFLFIVISMPKMFILVKDFLRDMPLLIKEVFQGESSAFYAIFYLALIVYYIVCVLFLVKSFKSYTKGEYKKAFFEALLPFIPIYGYVGLMLLVLLAS